MISSLFHNSYCLLSKSEEISISKKRQSSSRWKHEIWLIFIDIWFTEDKDVTDLQENLSELNIRDKAVTDNEEDCATESIENQKRDIYKKQLQLSILIYWLCRQKKI